MISGGPPFSLYTLCFTSKASFIFRCLNPLPTTGSKGEPCFWPLGQFLFDKNTARLYLPFRDLFKMADGRFSFYVVFSSSLFASVDG
jgi:hypothetical protein